MKKPYTALAGMVAMLGCATILEAQTMPDKLPAPVAQQIAAVNSGDVQTWLSLFPENGVVNDWGRRYVGHDEIRGWSDREFIGAKGRMTVLKSSVDGDTVTVDAGWKSSFYSGDSRFVFVVVGDKVQEMRITSLK